MDFKVKVPAGVRFVARTVNGGIDAAGLGGDVRPTPSTAASGWRPRATSARRPSTARSGLVRARRTGTGPIDFKTVNGGIAWTCPANASADVKAATVNGDIETDFPLTVKGRVSSRRLSGTIGSGGRQLALETVNGGIRLKKLS